MMRKRSIYTFLIGALLLSLLVGCQKEEKENIASPYIYYVDAERTSLKKEPYEIQGKGKETQIEQMLDMLRKEPESPENKSVFPEGVTVDRFEISEENVDIHFNPNYANMSKADEVLLRAAVVQSVVQIEGVEYVSFYIGDDPLTDSEGEVTGYMHQDNFVKNVGSSLHSYQVAKLQLYFANKEGDKLTVEEVNIRYNSNMSVEKLIVERLIKGPSVQGNQPTLLPETKVIGVSVKDNICYVNFDESFISSNYANESYALDPQLSIYSIVNSIIDAGTASQVQISVNGETAVQFLGRVDLSKPFSRNLDVVEETKKSKDK